MKILIEDRWQDHFLDETLTPGRVRIQVYLWKNLERLEGLYFVRPRQVSLIWNYWKEVGWKNVLRKIRSRLGERYRNEKYFSLGLGQVLEVGEKGKFRPGDWVCFIAPSHPRCMERVVLPEALVSLCKETVKRNPGDGELHYYGPAGEKSASEVWWEMLRGWSPESGFPLPADLRPFFEKVRQVVANLGKPEKILPLGTTSPIREFVLPKMKTKSGDQRLSGCLLGYGNYAKTTILPNIREDVRLERIHEIDPTQIPLSAAMKGIGYDTAPFIRPEEKYQVYFISGFHHTHAPLAMEALRQGAFAVVEKPLVTHRQQLEELVKVMEAASGKLFTCYQRRYLPFNEMTRRDLAVQGNGPIHYHCIVYEVPLPPLHWYRWPNSRSRLLSNGCHWIDHFLFLNHYVEPVRFNLDVAANGSLNVSIELQNGAYFTMLLTDQGSERIGMSDYVELRAANRTVRIVRGAYYEAESSTNILRKARINKLSVYQIMYRTIVRRIRSGEPGDSLPQITVLNRLLLDLEDLLDCPQKRA